MFFRIISAICGATGITAAAFAAHGLEKIADPEQVRWWAIAVSLQLVTAPVLLLLATSSQPVRRSAAVSMMLGLLLFSGSLYAMALGGPRWLGAVTPLGGLALIVGWLLTAWPPTKAQQS